MKKNKEDKYIILYNDDQIDKDRKSLYIWKWIAIGMGIMYIGIIILNIITH